jgi:hypothetical protein
VAFSNNNNRERCAPIKLTGTCAIARFDLNRVLTTFQFDLNRMLTFQFDLNRVLTFQFDLNRVLVAEFVLDVQRALEGLPNRVIDKVYMHGAHIASGHNRHRAWFYV